MTAGLQDRWPLHAQVFPLKSLPERFDATCPVIYGPARLTLRVCGPVLGGLPYLSWMGGHPTDSADWRALRLCVDLISAARKLEDPNLIGLLASYPRCAAILDAAAGLIAREVGLIRAIDAARQTQEAGKAGLSPSGLHEAGQAGLSPSGLHEAG